MRSRFVASSVLFSFHVECCFHVLWNLGTSGARSCVADSTCMFCPLISLMRWVAAAQGRGWVLAPPAPCVLQVGVEELYRFCKKLMQSDVT